MGGYPINPVVSGLSQAVALAQALRGMAMQREALERAIRKEERENEFQEFQTNLGLLQSGARPVTEGRHEAELPGPTFTAPPGVNLPAERTTVRAQVPTPTERTVAYRGRRYYVPTTEEKRASELAGKVGELKSLGDVETQLAVGKARALLPVEEEAAQVEVPGEGRVHRAAIPVITGRQTAAAAATREASRQTFAAGESAKLRKSQENVARIRTEARDVTTANQQRLERKDREAEFDDLVASEVVQRAGTEADEKRIRVTLDGLVEADKTGTVKKRYLPILRKARAGAVKPRTVGQMSPQELMQAIADFGEGKTAGAAAAEAPKAKKGTAAELIAEIEAKKRKAQQR